MTTRRAQALVLEAPQTLTAQEIDLPVLQDDDAILEIEACGLCGTDHEQYSGALFPGYPFIPGHEVIGRIAEIGSAAQAEWNVDPGDRVAVEIFLPCGRCTACEGGAERDCTGHRITDMYGFRDVRSDPGLWGGYSTHLYLAPRTSVLRVPEGLDPVAATMFNPIGAGIRWGATLPKTKPGDVVAVLGPGIRGLSVAAAAKDAGAEFVMITGVGPVDNDRLALASQFGADLAVDVSVENPVKQLKGSTGRLADVVVDVTANAPKAFIQALQLVRPGGTVVVAGTRGPNTIDQFSPDLIVLKEIRLIGALGVDSDSYRAALDLLASGRYPFEELPREVVGLDGAAELINRMAGESELPRPVHGVIAPNL